MMSSRRAASGRKLSRKQEVEAELCVVDTRQDKTVMHLRAYGPIVTMIVKQGI